MLQSKKILLSIAIREIFNATLMGVPLALLHGMAAASNPSLADVLADHKLVVRHTLTLAPEQFLPQQLRPSVAGIFVQNESAPLAVAHRRVRSRAQSHVELAPGGCLLRGVAARREWTLAIPPLLAPLWRRGGSRTRVVAPLADVEIDVSGEDECDNEDISLQVHRARE